MSGDQGNTASNLSATVGGGLFNNASGERATVGGGQANDASGYAATVPGGWDNTAAGNYSFAAGFASRANHDGTFVWNCAGCFATSSSGGNQFVANAAGGLWFSKGTGGPAGAIAAGQMISTSTGAFLSTAGVWTDISDRNAKTAFAPVNGLNLLDALLGLPVQSWTYKAEGAGVRHIGPTAQDFYAAFGVGTDDTHLAALDTSGVALAAIQNVYGVVREQDAEIVALQESQTELLARVAALESEEAPAPAQRPVALPWLLLAGLGLLNVGGLAGFALARARRR